MKLRRITKKLIKYFFKFAPTNNIRIWLLRSAGYIIGEKVYIGEDFIISDTLIERNNLTIKDRVSIAPRVTIITSSSPNNSRLLTMFPLESKRVVIEEDVWLGCGVIILPGVTIGKSSVIGAGSLVKNDIPSFSLAVGTPAKVVKKITIR